jgi:hypothetical protein
MSNVGEKSKSFGIAKLNWAGPDFWCVYADGYRRAAELLIECEKTVYETNTVIFPILALYRQHLELSLKEIIAYGQYLDGGGDMPFHHDLRRLWMFAKDYIVKYYLGFDQQQLDRLNGFIDEINYYDPTSEGARYPVVKPKGKAKPATIESFAHAPLFLNLDELHEHIRDAGQLLSDVTSTLAILQDFEADRRFILRS